MNMSIYLQRLIIRVLKCSGLALLVMFAFMAFGSSDAAAHSVAPVMTVSAGAPVKQHAPQMHATELRKTVVFVARNSTSDQPCTLGCCMPNGSCSSAGGCGSGVYARTADVNYGLTQTGAAMLWPSSILVTSRSIAPPARPPKHSSSV